VLPYQGTRWRGSEKVTWRSIASCHDSGRCNVGPSLGEGLGEVFQFKFRGSAPNLFRLELFRSFACSALSLLAEVGVYIDQGYLFI
jgi:hypothetical protein